MSFTAAAEGRLDQVLAGGGDMSRGAARRLVERGAVYLDGRRCKIASRHVGPGQRVEAVLEEGGRAEEPAATLVVLHEDDAVLAVDKPAGVASQAAQAGDRGTLPWLVARHLGVPVAQVHTVHRLDRETSGVVVFGKDAAATRALAAAFREGTAEKEYAAIVHGALVGEGVIDAPLRPSRTRRGSFEVGDGGVPAVTRWVAAGGGDRFSAVRLFPETGRTHQLRVHLSHLGHPIVGDLRYGGGRVVGAQRTARMLLHARSLSLPHPRGGRLQLRAPLPEALVPWSDPAFLA